MAKLPAGFVETANERFEHAKDFLSNWKGECKDDFAFISGQQWLADDEQYLREQKRPTVTFNYSEKMIDAVVGAEVSNRQEVTYRPREASDAAVAELWNNGAKAQRDDCNAEDEETDAFRDALICGLGCTHTRMSYDENLDGNIVIDRVDPGEMLYDPAAKKPGLVDRRYNFRVWWVDKKEAAKEWPNAIFEGSESEGNSGIVRPGHGYEDDEGDSDLHKDQVQLRHYECYEKEVVWRVEGPNGMIELDQAEFSKVKDDLDAAETGYVKQFRKVYYRGFFAGETLLEGGKSPIQKGFTFQFITGKRDRNRNVWYGLTRVMKDPQRWANKWLSQILHIVNSNAKGGLLAETGAFVDPRKAQDEWAMPESITMLNEGGISKIKPKEMANYPSGLDKLMEFALGSLPMVTGINLEALGLANREQAGVLEQQRKQAAYGLLAPLFDALRRYRKTQGKVFLEFMNLFISDGRMVRIGGQESARFVPLTRVEGAAEYDVFVDQSPNAPDVKDKTWQTLTQLLPSMMKAGMPIPPDLLDYSPLPVALSEKWKAFIAEQKQNQGPTPEQMQQLQQEMQKMQQETQKLQQQNQQLQQQLKDKGGDLQLKQAEAQANLQLEKEKAQAEILLEREKFQAEIAFEREKVQAELQMQQEKMIAELRLKQDDMEGKLMISDAQGEAQSSALRYKTNAEAISKLIASISKLTDESED